MVCGDELRRDDNSVLLVALDLEVSGNRKRERPKKIWKKEKKQVEEKTEKISLKKGGCSKSRQVERRSARNCIRNGVNPAISAKGQHRIKTEKLLLLLLPLNELTKTTIAF